MSHSDVLQGEVETLRRLRRHRADRAERALREAKRAQQALLAHIQRAKDALEQTRQEEARKSAELLSQHQGQVLSLKELKAWGARERSLSASTRREQGQLVQLQDQQGERNAALEALRSTSPSVCGKWKNFRSYRSFWLRSRHDPGFK